MSPGVHRFEAWLSHQCGRGGRFEINMLRERRLISLDPFLPNGTEATCANVRYLYVCRFYFRGYTVPTNEEVGSRSSLSTSSFCRGDGRCAHLCSQVVSKEVMSARPIAISLLNFALFWSSHGLVFHVVFCIFRWIAFWFLSNEKRNRLLHALFGRWDDAWQSYLDRRATQTPKQSSAQATMKVKSKKTSAQHVTVPSVHSRVPWTSLTLVSEFTDSKDSLPHITKATQNGKGVCFCELSDMESTLQLCSDHALAILVPAQRDKHVIPPNFAGPHLIS